MRTILPAIVLISVSACTEVPPETAPSPPKAGICNADTVQSYVGQMLEGDSGERILRESGAETLRWGPPDSAWTMDYRETRVNVRYDRAMTITAITCG